MKRKAFIFAGIAVLAAGALSLPAYAAWHENGYGWWYDNGDGTYPVSCWQWIDGNGDGLAECYCFNEEGYLYTSTVTPDGYAVNQDGAWTVDGAVQTKQAEQGQQAADLSVTGTYQNSATGETAVFSANVDGSYRLLAECNGYVIDYDILVYVGDGMYTDRWGFLCTIENGTLSFVADWMHVYSRVG